MTLRDLPYGRLHDKPGTGQGGFAVVLGAAAVFFMAAASTGLIPGVAPLGHGYD